jgi:Sel1 repeat
MFLQIIKASLMLTFTWLTLTQAALSNPLRDKDMQSLWEVLWDQRGYPRSLAFWKKTEQPIRYALIGEVKPAHLRRTAETFELMTALTELRFEQMSSGVPSEANILIEITKNARSNQEMPCYMQALEWKDRHYKKIKIVMRDDSVWDCMLHEVLHGMGLPGHPSGDTVLSYFPYRQDKLSDLDQIMLFAIYIWKMPPFATPFEALPVMMNALIGQQQFSEVQKREAEKQAVRFMLQVVEKMEQFASGKGEIPPVIRRSGRASEEVISTSRSTMAYYLGTAYEDGDIVQKSASSAFKWYLVGAREGDIDAMAAAGISYYRGFGVAADRVEGWKWLAKASAGGSDHAKNQLEKLSAELSTEELAKLNASL